MMMMKNKRRKKREMPGGDAASGPESFGSSDDEMGLSRQHSTADIYGLIDRCLLFCHNQSGKRESLFV